MIRDLLRRTKTYLLQQGWKWAAPRVAAAAAAVAGGYWVPWNVTTYVIIAVVVLGGLAMAGRAYSEAVSVAQEANENAAKAVLRAMKLEKRVDSLLVSAETVPTIRSTFPSPAPRIVTDEEDEPRGRHAAAE